MSKREKMLAMVVAVIGAGYGGFEVGLPLVDRYVFAVARENAALREELKDKDARLSAVEPFRKTYSRLLSRTRSVDPVAVKNALHAKLTQLIDASGLSNPRVSPRAISDYRPPDRKLKKAGIKLVRFNVTAEGSLQAIVGFLKSFYELPYITRMTTLKLDPPAGRARRSGGAVKMTASVEALVPPYHPVGEVNPARLEQPARLVKHLDKDYTVIASRHPFTEYVKPAPPKPKPRPKPPEPKIVERPKAPPEPAPPRPPPPPAGDRDREHKVVRMVMMYGDGDRSIDEVLVVDTRDKSSEHVRLGEKLDGGDVILVHPTGAASRREDGTTRVYGIGLHLSDGVLIEEAAPRYPEIVYAFDAIKDRFEPHEEPPVPVGDDAAGQAGDGEQGTPAAGDASGDKAGDAAVETGEGGTPGGKSRRAVERARLRRDALRRRQSRRPVGPGAGGKAATPGPADANKKAGPDKPASTSEAGKQDPASKAKSTPATGGKKPPEAAGPVKKAADKVKAPAGPVKKAAVKGKAAAEKGKGAVKGKAAAEKGKGAVKGKAAAGKKPAGARKSGGKTPGGEKKTQDKKGQDED